MGVVTLSSSASTAMALTACPSGYYPLLCRGPLSLNPWESTGNRSVTIRFKKNTVSSGTDGVSLAQGSCAWGDRALYPSEPLDLFWWLPSTNAARDMMERVIVGCSNNANCVMVSCVSASGGVFNATQYPQTVHPFN